MKYTLLAADDEKSVHDLLKKIFDPGRYQILSAFDGGEVHRMALRERPDLVLLDIHMPVKDGRQVLLELRQDARTRMVPVLILTGHMGETLSEAEGFELGADDYIEKPFVPDALEARVDAALRRNARFLSANPLTQLPGGPAIEHEIRYRASRGEPFELAYLDVDHFRKYNEAQGHEAGDTLLQDLADILREASFAANNVFVGHIGEDDFILLSEPGMCENLVKDIVTKFKKWLSDSATLSIVITSTRDHDFKHHAKLMDLVKEFKNFLKNRKDHQESVYIKHRARPKQAG